MKYRLNPKINRTLLDRALSSVDLAKNEPCLKVERRAHFVLARHDHIVLFEEGMQLVRGFQRACPNAEVTVQETWGGHATTLVLRPALMVDGVAKMAEQMIHTSK